MSKLIPILIGAFVWGWLTQRTTIGTYGQNRYQTMQNRFFFFMLVLTLALPITLRRSYNDTGTYINSFMQAQPLKLLLESGKLHILSNPAFRIYESLVRTYTDNHMIFFLFPAFFVQYSYLRFIRRHSPSLMLGLALYIFLGTYTFSIAAMKQTIAMAILLFAVDALIERKHIRYLLLVFVAFLFHTYAIAFLILPLFTAKPWSLRTYVLLFVVYFVMRNFESIIGGFLDFAQESGKSISEEEVIGTAAINPIRVAVYAVVPLLALIFRRFLYRHGMDRELSILINMSIFSVAIMSIGLINAANMFARMGQYFEFGLICSLPCILERTFNKRSAKLTALAATLCFFGYFCYANLIQIYFDDHFGRYTVMYFIRSLLS